MNFTTKRKMRNGQNRNATKKRTSGIRMNLCREVKEGYPKPEGAMNKDEIERYFSGAESITCLLCGKEFGALSYHLKRIHSITADEYKQKYGLPFRVGLTSNAVREKARKQGAKIYKKYLLPDAHENRKKARQAIKDGKMRQSAYKKQCSLDNIHGIKKAAYKNIEDFRKILCVMVDNDCSANEALKIKNENPSAEKTWFYQFKRENPEAHKEFLETIDKLSERTIVHASYGKYSKKIKEKVLFLLQRHTYREVSEIIGIGVPLIKELSQKQ